jgi:predicted nucleotidyltransferase
MNIPDDFKEFIRLLNENKVKYLIVGGYAVGFYSQPKFTQDIDFWIDYSEENIKSLLKVLNNFGFTKMDKSINQLKNPNKMMQLGNPPLRIDIMTSISGINFKKAYKNKIDGNYLGIKANFISLKDLLINKKASKRKKDLDDLDWIKTYSKE